MLTIQPSFSKGEIAPALYGRVDIALYQVALRAARNAIVHAYGGISNRPGTRFICPVKTHSYAPRLITFQFKASDAYILEFGDEYMRVIRDDVLQTEAAKVITGITQANPGVVTVTAHGYSTGDQVYLDGIVGMSRLNGRWFTVGTTTADTFQLKDQVTGANVDTTALTAYSSGGTAAKVYQITTPYDVTDLPNLKYTQSADVMTLTHKDYAVRKLTRTGHTSWTLTVEDFTPDISTPTGMTLTVNGADDNAKYAYKITAIAAETFEESLPGLNNATLTITAISQANPAVVTSTGHALRTGDEVYIANVVGMTEVNGRRFMVDVVDANNFRLRDEDSTGHTAYSSGGTAQRTFVITTDGTTAANNTLAWTAVAGAVKYAVYKQTGTLGVYGLIGETEHLTFTDLNLTPDTDVTPPAARNPFDDAGEYPGTSNFYEQRQVYGGSDDKPDTSFFSQTGNQSNMTTASPAQADDAITATLASREVNEIRHYVPGNDLITLTSGGEWRINSGQDTAFTASSIKQKPQSKWGSSHLAPHVAGSVILFVTENLLSVRSLDYSFQRDGYTGNDLTLSSHHLFEDTSIKDWCYAQSPDPIVYVVKNDGDMACMTFQVEQEVLGWTRWDTQGKFEAAAAIKHEEGGVDDRVYFVVKRRINGNTVRYIERAARRRFNDVKDCFFVDCGLTLDEPVTISGVSLANPGVVTATSHGFSNGDEVDIDDIEWEPNYDRFRTEYQPGEQVGETPQLNGNRYVVRNATSNTFTLEDENGDAVDTSAFNAYVEGGTVRKAVATVSGLDHLEGAMVSVLSDGDHLDDLVVEDGAITLPRKGARVHVGLEYITDIETLNVEAPNARGTMQGKLQKVNYVIVRTLKTRGLLVGPNKTQLVEMKQREFERMGEPTRLMTDDKKITLDPKWNSNGRVFIRQRYPLPMTILAIIPDRTFEAKGE